MAGPIQNVLCLVEVGCTVPYLTAKPEGSRAKDFLEVLKWCHCSPVTPLYGRERQPCPMYAAKPFPFSKFQS